MQKIQFSDMELSNEMQRAVEEMGFEEPTSIQAASIPMILSGRDVIRKRAQEKQLRSASRLLKKSTRPAGVKPKC